MTLFLYELVPAQPDRPAVDAPQRRSTPRYTATAAS